MVETETRTTNPTVHEVLIGMMFAVAVSVGIAFVFSSAYPQCNEIRSMTSNFTNMNMTLPINVLGAFNQSDALQTCMQGVRYG